MPYIQFHCPTCNKKVESIKSFVLGKNRIHKLSCNHSYYEHLIEKESHKANLIESLDHKKLMPFQITGVEFVEKSNINCLIADEMGLGKTIQALASLKLHSELM